MKKAIISGMLALSCLVTATTGVMASEKVAVWDGAEVVKHQTGKMTFSKDVKVYKKNKKGEFESLVVPKGNFFRVYDVEKYGGETYYWMSSGYRVQKTDLVISKAMPIEIRREFFEDPVSINISRNPIDTNIWYMDANSEQRYKTNIAYGQILHDEGWAIYVPKGTEGELHTLLDPTDIKLVEKTAIAVPHASYRVKEDTLIYDNPMGNKNSKTISIEKGTVVKGSYYIINGYMQVSRESNYKNLNSFIPVSKLEKQ